MMSNWKVLGLEMMLAWTLAAANPPYAQAADNLAPNDQGGSSDKPAKALDREELKKLIGEVLDQKLEKVKKDIADDFQARFLNKGIEAQNSFREQLKELRDGDLKAIQDELSRLRAELNALKKAGPPTTSAYAGAPPSGATGKVRLINTFPQPQTVLINGRPYGLAPNETRTFDLPAGSFTYEVRGVTETRTKTVNANETFTIDIHPPTAAPGAGG